MKDSTDLGTAEFQELRATIRERGSLRLFVTFLTFVAWAVIQSLPGIALGRPSAMLIPLVVLAAGFEVMFAAHVGVERVGRYVALRFETTEGGGARWERTVTALGREPGAALPTDPLFVVLFLVAAVINVARPLFVLVDRAQIMASPETAAWVEWLVVLGMHLIFAGRLFHARHVARGQRARDTELLARAMGPDLPR